MEPALGWRHQHLLELTSAKVDGFVSNQQKNILADQFMKMMALGEANQQKWLETYK